MRRGWYERWRENGWLNRRKESVANRDLWESCELDEASSLNALSLAVTHDHGPRA